MTSAAGLFAGRLGAEARTLFTNPQLAETYARVLQAAQAGGGTREAEIERAQELSPGLCRRGGRQVLLYAGGHGYVRRAPSRRAER